MHSMISKANLYEYLSFKFINTKVYETKSFIKIFKTMDGKCKEL